jgi:hypothetical protein
MSEEKEFQPSDDIRTELILEFTRARIQVLMAAFSFGFFVLLSKLLDAVKLFSPIFIYIENSGGYLLVIILTIISIFLYGLRSNFPATYGAIEIFVGVTAINTSIVHGFPNGSIQAVSVISILGGMYIVVRGLDNIDKSIPDEYRVIWNVLKWKLPTKEDLPVAKIVYFNVKMSEFFNKIRSTFIKYW